MYDLIILVGGLMLLVYSAQKVITSSTKLSKALRITPLLVGAIILSIGTDLPELVTSVISSSIGHGDIVVGNVFGSILTQGTLVIGIIALIRGKLRGDKKDVILVGVCMLLGIVFAITIAEKGFISRVDATLLILAYFILTYLSRKYQSKEYEEKKEIASPAPRKQKFYFATTLALSILGIIISSSLIIDSVINISEAFNIPEYLLAFFTIALGTSLPELAVGIAAVLKKNYSLAVGEVLGSNLVDATLVLGVGGLVAPISISRGYSIITGWYVIIASIIVLGIYAFKGNFTRKTGAVLIGLYALAFLIAAVPI